MRNWIKRTWMKIRAWLFGIFVALGLIANVAFADDVILSWVNATQNEDATPLPIEDIAETVLFKQTFPLGTDIVTTPRSYVELARVLATVTTYVDANQVNGIHCYVAIHIHVNGQPSKDSNEFCKTIDLRVPGSPTGLTGN